MSLLVRAGARELARHPVQLVLAVAGVALGVAVGVAVDLTNESARRAFYLSTEATAGRATHAITAGAAGLDERLFPRLRLEIGLRDTAPVVEGELRLPEGAPRRTLRLLGVDPLSEGAFRPEMTLRSLDGEAVGRLLTTPGAVAMTTASAAELGVAPGDRLDVVAGARAVAVTLAARIEPADDLARQALAGVAFADVATAQELLGRVGRLDRIELVLPSGEPGAAAAARIRSLLPDDARLAAVGARTAAFDRLTRAFRFNLRALSLLALLCGAFLVFNTATFSVVRRRDLFGRLRAAGVDGRRLVGAIAGEALLLGAVGSLLGLVAGVALGRGLVALVLTTIDDLYFRLTVRQFAVPLSTLVVGLVLGVGTTLAATLMPAIEASRAPLRNVLALTALEARADRWARRGAVAGGVLVAGGALLLVAPGIGAALAGFLLLVVGGALFVPFALARGLAGAAGRGSLWSRLAARGVVRSLARTGPAAAALALAVAVSLAIALTVTSFRAAVVDWLEATLVGDLYVSASAGAGGPASDLPVELATAVAALPDVRRVVTLRATELPAQANDVAPRLLGIETDAEATASLVLRAGDREPARAALAAGRAAWISEPLAESLGLGPGDAVRVPTPTGTLELPVAAIYVDYGSERGAIAIAAPLYDRSFPGLGLAALALRLGPDADAAALARRIEELAAPLVVETRSNRELKRYSLAVFDRTFRVTGVLRTLALVVAALGIAAALSAVELERGRHFALLRTLGLSRAGVAAVVLGECAALGAASGLAALPLGGGLAALLVLVVQRRSFGWSFPLELTWGPFAETLLLAVATAVVAGSLAALRLALRAPVEALREE